MSDSYRWRVGFSETTPDRPIEPEWYEVEADDEDEAYSLAIELASQDFDDPYFVQIDGPYSTDSNRFTKRERYLMMNAVKPHRFDSDEYYDLYKKVSKWCYDTDGDQHE